MTADAPPPPMPALFIGHGSPMNTLEDNAATRAWAALGQALPRPRAILAISAHWHVGATAVTAMERPRTIHDFRGFPPELFAFDYPAPGLPALAAEVAALLAPEPVLADTGQWGLDHGTWSVLAHLFPGADVPVVQLSLNATKPLAWHLEQGARLAPLRDRGVLILASGNVVHNLGRIRWDMGAKGFDWAARFDAAVEAAMLDDPGRLAAIDSHPDWPLAVPTDEHFLPLMYVAGLARAGGGARLLVRGLEMGSLSMTSFGVGL